MLLVHENNFKAFFFSNVVYNDEGEKYSAYFILVYTAVIIKLLLRQHNLTNSCQIITMTSFYTKLTSSSCWRHLSSKSFTEDSVLVASSLLLCATPSDNTSVAKLLICPFKLFKLWFKLSHDILDKVTTTKVRVTYHG